MSRSGLPNYGPFSCLSANCVLPIDQPGHLHRNYRPISLTEAPRLEFRGDIFQISTRYRHSLFLTLCLLLPVARFYLQAPITSESSRPNVQRIHTRPAKRAQGILFFLHRAEGTARPPLKKTRITLVSQPKKPCSEVQNVVDQLPFPG